jgi:O-6-methylguanine DNA methyltransferase
MEEIYYYSVSSPIGKIWVASDRIGVRLLRFRLREEEFLNELRGLLGCDPRADQKLNRELAAEIMAYFEGKVIRFSSPLHIVGSPFEMKVWEALLTIPLGETRSYEEIAQAVGNPRGCRAIGGANRENPIPLLIPCHRVIRKDGGLGGFSSGTEIKAWLLRFEQKVIGGLRGGKGRALD